METRRTSAICIQSKSVIDDYHNLEDQCSLEGPARWHELEQFWGDEKHRLQDFDNQAQQLSSSLEKHLLFDDSLDKPKEISSKTPKDENCFISELSRVIKGEDINDIPTSYVINGFKPHELVVIGTYVDKRVTPGFKYKIRKNHTEKYLFGGKALCLEQIGLGYGKRLTFESECLNKNNNYFWSDSYVSGFGFSMQAVSPGDVFIITDPVSREYCGRVVVTTVKEEQIEKSTIFEEKGRIEKLIEVQFWCDAVLTDCTNKQNLFIQDVVASGIAVLVKDNPSCAAEVKSIQLSDFIIKDCELKPEN